MLYEPLPIGVVDFGLGLLALDLTGVISAAVDLNSDPSDSAEVGRDSAELGLLSALTFSELGRLS